MRILFLFLFSAIASSLFAQFHVRGKVVESEYGDKLSDVIVKVDGTDICSITDSTGNYKITIPDGIKKPFLVFEKPQFEKLYAKVNDYYEITVVLASLLPPDKHVEVGYGTQRSTEITGSVGTIGQGSYHARSYVAQTKSLKSLQRQQHKD